MNWPPLPAKGFVSGRTATDEDVAAGNAVFVLKAYGTLFRQADGHRHSAIRLFDQGRRKPVPVIVVQAEIGKGIKLFGVRGLDGDKSTAPGF